MIKIEDNSLIFYKIKVRDTMHATNRYCFSNAQLGFQRSMQCSRNWATNNFIYFRTPDCPGDKKMEVMRVVAILWFCLFS